MLIDNNEQSKMMLDHNNQTRNDKDRSCLHFVYAVLTVWSYVICIGIMILIFAAALKSIMIEKTQQVDCSSTCRFQLVESIPENLTFPSGSPQHPSTFETWQWLLSEAQHEVNLAVFYWSLLPEDVQPGSDFPSAWQGKAILDMITKVGTVGNVTIKIAQNAPTVMSPQNESELLRRIGAAQVRSVDIKGLVGGVLHTKMWLVDDDKLYLGSANMDFRSLTQVKELGVMISNCSCLVQDMQKIFEEYWLVGGNNAIPTIWPPQYSTSINLLQPLTLTLNGGKAAAAIASSPPPFTASGRLNDVDAIVSVIDDARVSVDVAVMDYFPRTLYTHRTQFWPVLDDALRRAAVERGVRVRVLASHWQHSRSDLRRWLLSLRDLSSRPGEELSVVVEAKLFVVPAYSDEQKNIPFGRVNHNKYMVTDRVAYIGTSNWSGDYFINTGGVGLIINETGQVSGIKNDKNGDPSLREQLQAVFNRDWNSQYALPLENFLAEDNA